MQRVRHTAGPNRGEIITYSAFHIPNLLRFPFSWVPEWCSFSPFWHSFPGQPRRRSHSLGLMSPDPRGGLPSSLAGSGCRRILELSLPPLAETWHSPEESGISLGRMEFAVSAVTQLSDGDHCRPPRRPPHPLRARGNCCGALQGACLSVSFLLSLSSHLIYFPNSSFSPILTLILIFLIAFGMEGKGWPIVLISDTQSVAWLTGGTIRISIPPLTETIRVNISVLWAMDSISQSCKLWVTPSKSEAFLQCWHGGGQLGFVLSGFHMSGWGGAGHFCPSLVCVLAVSWQKDLLWVSFSLPWISWRSGSHWHLSLAVEREQCNTLLEIISISKHNKSEPKHLK